MRFAKVLLASAALAGASASASAQQAGCAAMLNGAPENVLQLEAVRSCRGESAACGYLNGVITLICPAGVRQVVGAERIRSLRFRNGALAGECSSGAWRRDAGLPGCYP